MDELTQRDLSNIPESQLSEEEQRELERRKKEFLALLRRKGGLPSAEPKPSKPKAQPWDPRAIARARR